MEKLARILLMPRKIIQSKDFKLTKTVIINGKEMSDFRLHHTYWKCSVVGHSPIVGGYQLTDPTSHQRGLSISKHVKACIEQHTIMGPDGA
jgi:hypothetical protein